MSGQKFVRLYCKDFADHFGGSPNCCEACHEDWEDGPHTPCESYVMVDDVEIQFFHCCRIRGGNHTDISDSLLIEVATAKFPEEFK